MHFTPGGGRVWAWPTNAAPFRPAFNADTAGYVYKLKNIACDQEDVHRKIHSGPLSFLWHDI